MECKVTDLSNIDEVKECHHYDEKTNEPICYITGKCPDDEEKQNA